ncbi:MAG: PEP-utilizing enzyme [Patescibacteria group bacterium]|nr:PEP-utilizing enzyme [Patescibacteria group bacterium]
MNISKIIKHADKGNWYCQGGSIMPFFMAVPYLSMSREIGAGNMIAIQDKFANKGYFEKNQEKIKADYYIKKFLKRPKLLLDNIKIWRKTSKAVQRQLKIILLLESKNENVLSKEINKFINMSISAWINTLLIEELDPWGKSILKKYTGKYNLADDELAILTGPRKLSYLQHERIARCKAAQSQEPMENLSKEHWRKYYWYLTSWEKAPKTSPKYFKRLLERDRKNLKLAVAEVKAINDYLLKQAEERQKILKKYNFDPSAKKIFKIFSILSDWRDERKAELTCKINYDLERFLDKLAELNNLPVSLLFYAYISELTTFKLSAPYIELLRKRRGGLYAVYEGENSKYIFLYGKDALRLSKALQHKIRSVSERVNGSIAFPGIIRGKVRVVNSFKEMRKMQKGEIMLSVMTRPDLLPAIKKASAIVTDEGGITCHAAIISRELKIPCLVGTQVATIK